jgi:osmotically-inducible protein OsmY
VVSNASAYLYGTVATEFQKSEAEHVASGVNGIVDVNNYLTVTAKWEYKTDWEIKQDVEDQLHWDPDIDESAIEVKVKDGVATLSGTVETWYERSAATDNAHEGGARKVINSLTVLYGPAYYRP